MSSYRPIREGISPFPVVGWCVLLLLLAVPTSCRSCGEAACRSTVAVTSEATEALTVCLEDECSDQPIQSGGSAEFHFDRSMIGGSSRVNLVVKSGDGRVIDEMGFTADLFRPYGPDCGPVCGRFIAHLGDDGSFKR